MSLHFINQVPTADEIKKAYPISEKALAAKAKRDEEIKKVITGESDKFLVIIGPCSR